MTAVTLHDTGKQNSSALIVGNCGKTKSTHRIRSTHTPMNVISAGRNV